VAKKMSYSKSKTTKMDKCEKKKPNRKGKTSEGNIGTKTKGY